MRNQPTRTCLWLCIICLFSLIFSTGFSPALAQKTVPLSKPLPQIKIERSTSEPWLNLSAIHPVGDALPALNQAAESIQPLSLAGVDLNGDNAPELVAGYAVPGGGLLAIYPGNADRTATTPFLPQASALDLIHAPTWLGSGDFNADGYADLIAASQGIPELTLLTGDGSGNLDAPQSLPLPAGVTALATGELDRQDGLADIAISLENGQVLVFGGDAAAPTLRRSLSLPAPATALAIGQLDDHFAYDLAILSGKQLWILHGQDQLAGDDLEAASVDRIELGFAGLDLALGDFHAPDGQLLELAVLGSDGSLHLYDRQGQALVDSALNQERLTASASARLLHAKTSALPGDDLLLLDPTGETISYLNASLGGSTTGAPLLASLNPPAPRIALALRLNRDALSDLVFLSDASPIPYYALTDPVRIFVVNGDFWDVDDEDPGDGVCETLSWLDGRHCNLRAAIQEANASAGLDEIQLGFVTSPNKALPAITEALILTGTDPGAEINGTGAGVSYGLHFTSEASTVQDLKIRQFMQPAIYLHTGGNHLIDNVQVGSGNLNNGIAIETSDNTILYSTIVGNSGDGIAINGGDNNSIRNNWIGVTASGTASGNSSSGIYLYAADNTAIGNAASTRNVISGNDNGGIQIGGGSAGTLVQSNYIGLKGDGSTALGNDGIGGVEIGFASSTTLGGASTAYRNYISANRLGVTVTGNAAAGTVIRNNYFGLTATAAGGVANTTHAIKLYTTGSSNSVQVRDNVLAGGPNTGHGVLISNAVTPAQCIAHNISDNLLGTNPARNANLGFGLDGIHLQGVKCVSLTGNTVYNSREDGIDVSGNSDVYATLTGNIVSGNAGNGINLATPFNTLTNNIANHNFNGVSVYSDSNTLINTTASSNLNSGVTILGNNNLVQGPGNPSAMLTANQFEGLVLSGNDNTVLATHISSNVGTGVRVIGDRNIIGGSASGNWINGNAYGIVIEPEANATTVLDNFIGVEADGVTPSGNGFANILIRGSNASIGSLNAGNVIADAPVGILINGGATVADIQYNQIGTNASGNAGLPNGVGIKIENGNGNHITDNQIAYNGDGVIVMQGAGNRMIDNEIYNSTRLAIDLYPAGVTINDTGDTDSGANNLQNYPVITAAGVSGDRYIIQASFQGMPNTPYTFQFFSNPTCDPSGHGEAFDRVGNTTRTTEANGNYFIDIWVNFLTLNHYVSATATDPSGNTSELSPCVKIGVVGGSETFIVNTTTDVVDANLSDGVCDSDLGTAGEQCSLRAAVQQANQNSGANTILLPIGDFLITRGGTDNTALNGDFDLTGDLTIIGAGAHLTHVDGNSQDRVFDIRPGAYVFIQGVTVQNGYPGSSAGGGILINSSATLDLDGVTVINNSVGAAGGGGIYNQGTLNVANSAMMYNQAGMNGGGLWQWGGTSTWLNSTFSGNTASGHGGAIAAESSGSVTLNNVTIAFNTADDNNTGDDGGGIYQSGATVSLQNSIVAENSDLSAEGYPNGHADCFGALTSTGYNLIGDQAKQNNANPPGCILSGGTGDSIGGFWLISNYITWYAGLEPTPELNGGTTLSHSPIASAAGMSVDWGNPGAPGTGGGTCEAFDQRGQARPIDGGTNGIAECDRGAVELIPVTVSVNDVTVAEGGVAQFEVSLSDSVQIDFSIDYAVTGLSATAGSDFQGTSGTLTFTAGETSKLVPVTTLTDTFDEADETFQFELSNAQYVFIADGVGIGVIQDASPQPSILVNDVSVTEGGPGETAAASFTVTLNSPSGRQVSVGYLLEEASATAGEDYTAASGSLTFTPGQTSQSLTVIILGDNLQEGTETFTVRLLDPVNATTSDTGTGTIVDDDIPSFSINDARIIEGDSATREMYFYVFLSMPSTTPLSVNFQTTPGSAHTGSDFQNRNGTLSFAPGETVKYIAVNIVGDTLEESLETFTIALNTPTGGAVIGDGSATGTIEDNDGQALVPPEINLFLPLLRH